MTAPQGNLHNDDVQFQFADDLEPGSGYTPQEVDEILATPLDTAIIAAANPTESLYDSDTEKTFVTDDEHDSILMRLQENAVELTTEAYGSDRGLRNYWTHGEGAAKIRWGTPGDFNRCVRHLGKYVKNPQGLCNEYHQEAVGAPPGKGHSVESQSFALAADAPVQRIGTTAPNSVAWEGILALEGEETGDGREFSNGSLEWATPPLPLMYQYETSHGGNTDKSTNVGNITEIWRDGSKIIGRGTIDLDDEYGMQAARKMKNKYLNGVSIDADSVKEGDVELVFAPPPADMSEDEALLQMMTASPDKTIFHRGRVRGATLVNLPAFVGAQLNLTGDTSMLDTPIVASTVITNRDDYVITAAASNGKRGYTIEIPELPPLEFFQEPKDVPPIGAVWIEPNGHIWGLVGPSGVAHRAFKNKRVTIPMGNVDYTRWMNRPTLVEGPDGEVMKIRTGIITMNCGHMNPYASNDADERMRHYDNSCSVAALVRVGESRKHKAPWIAGTIMPMSHEDFLRLQACQLSGDWSRHSEKRGWREFVAALAVPVPGFARSTDVAAVRVDDNAVVVASTVPIKLSEDAYHLEDEMPFELTSEAYESNRLALGRIRARLGTSNRQTLAAIRERVVSGKPLTASAATATPPKEKKVGCTPCAAKAARQAGQTSAQLEQPPAQVPGFGDGDGDKAAQQSAANAIANTRQTSRG